MNENMEKILKKNFEEFFSLAEIAFKTNKFNGAAALYYKALVELCDLSLLKTINRIGANHSERFLLLEKHNPQLYEIASKLFRFYRDTYSKETPRAIAEIIRENVNKAKKLAKY